MEKLTTHRKVYCCIFNHHSPASGVFHPSVQLSVDAEKSGLKNTKKVIFRSITDCNSFPTTHQCSSSMRLVALFTKKKCLHFRFQSALSRWTNSIAQLQLAAFVFMNEGNYSTLPLIAIATVKNIIVHALRSFSLSLSHYCIFFFVKQLQKFSAKNKKKFSCFMSNAAWHFPRGHLFSTISLAA